MSFTQVDNFFPFDTGSGAAATPARWRLMARQWSGSGVIPGYQNQCQPSLAGSAITVATGGIWIDGFYGEITTAKGPISVSGGDGMLVARADPANRQIVLVYVLLQSTPAQTLTDIYEVPIARMASGVMIDIRQFAQTGPASVPSGSMLDYAGAVSPAGWLLCNGATYVRQDYPSLFAVIGTTFNIAGTDSTHFNVPDCRGRVAIGAGTGSYLGTVTPRALGAGGGEEAHILVTGELAAHNHGVGDPTHSHGVGDPGHYHGHTNPLRDGHTLITAQDGLATQNAVVGGSGNKIQGRGDLLTDAATTGVYTGGAATGVTTANNGSNTGHNTMQPFLVMTKIIKI